VVPSKSFPDGPDKAEGRRNEGRRRSQRPVHVLYDVIVSGSMTDEISMGDIQRRSVVTLIEFGSDEERVGVIEERGSFSGCVNTEEKMITFYQSVEVNACSKPILGQGSMILPLRQSYSHGSESVWILAANAQLINDRSSWQPGVIETEMGVSLLQLQHRHRINLDASTCMQRG
jgi:hypothetical protein